MATDVGQEQLQRVGGAADRPGVVRRGGLLGGCGLFVGGLADLDADALKLDRQLLDVLLREVVLERKGLELGRLDVAALLRALDERARVIAFKQFV